MPFLFDPEIQQLISQSGLSEKGTAVQFLQDPSPSVHHQRTVFSDARYYVETSKRNSNRKTRVTKFYLPNPTLYSTLIQ